MINLKIALIAAAVLLGGCENMSSGQKGAVAGGALGTGIGMVAGGSFGQVVGAGLSAERLVMLAALPSAIGKWEARQ